MKKLASTLVCTLAVACMVLVVILQTGAFAQTVPKPSVPEFTVKSVELETLGKFIEVDIKNPPFTPYTDAQGNHIELSYNLSVKGSNDNWLYCPINDGYQKPINASKGAYTIIKLEVDLTHDDPSFTDFYEIQNSGRLDFRVQAQIGYYEEYDVPRWLVPGGPYISLTFVGKESGWSSTKTISVGNEEVEKAPSTPAPSPILTESLVPMLTPTVTEPSSFGAGNLMGLNLEQTAILVLCVLVAVLLVTTVVVLQYVRKLKRQLEAT